MSGHMNADQVRALVQAKFPGAMQSPLAAMFAGVAAKDGADCAIGFAKLQADAGRAAVKREAHQHALDCIYACESQDIEYDAETLSHNIECSFPELSAEDCDDIATAALAKATGSAA